MDWYYWLGAVLLWLALSAAILLGTVEVLAYALDRYEQWLRGLPALGCKVRGHEWKALVAQGVSVPTGLGVQMVPGPSTTFIGGPRNVWLCFRCSSERPREVEHGTRAN